jgi:hypothetical protein
MDNVKLHEGCDESLTGDVLEEATIIMNYVCNIRN